MKEKAYIDDEIAEGNCVIAEFDGWVQDIKIKDRPYWHPERNMTMYTYPDGFKYHSSWDWLMPVVEKIELMGFTYRIESRDDKLKWMWIWEDEEDNPVASNYSKSIIECVYKAVVEFITWYNTQTKKQ